MSATLTRKKRNPKKRPTSLMLSVLGCAVFFLLFLGIEGITRIYWIHRLGPANFQIKWMRLTGACGVFDPKPGMINALGFHSREIPVWKGTDTFRVLVLGGSAVYGYEEIESSWTWYLEKRLKERLPGKNIEVINAGIPGGTSNETVDNLRDLVMLKPDLVIWYGGWNDVYYSHYCSDEWEARYRNFSYKNPWLNPAKSFNRWLEYHWFVFLVLKKNYKRWRHSLKSQRAGLIGNQPSPDLSRFNDRFNQVSDAKNFVTLPVHCQEEDRSYRLSGGPVPDHFSEIYEGNLLKMEETTKKQGIPFVVILQPNLAYSVSVKAVPEEARRILEKTSRLFYEDWLNASRELYPKALEVVRRLRGKKILAFEFASLFEGENAMFFTDSVHLKDPKALDIIAREVEEILTDHRLLPETPQGDNPKKP